MHLNNFDIRIQWRQSFIAIDNCILLYLLLYLHINLFDLNLK